MKSCDELKGSIAASVYGALDDPEARVLAAHLGVCVDCSRELDELTRAAERIGRNDRALTPAQRAQAVSGILGRVASGTRRSTVPARPRRTVVARRTWVVPTVAAAAVLLAFVSLLLFTQKSQPGPEPQPAVATPRRVEPTPAPPPPVLPPKKIDAPPPAPDFVVPEKPKVVEPEKPKPEPQPEPVEPPPAPEKTPAPTVIPKERLTLAFMARLEQVQGDVAVLTDAGRVPAKAGLDLLPGQEILTGPHAAFASIKVTDGTKIDLSSDTALRLVSDQQPGAGRSFQMGKGILSATVAKQPAGLPMIFRTPTGEAKVLGTRLVLDVTGDSTRLEVREGRVRLTRTDDGAGVDVPAGSFAVASKAAAPAAHPDRPSSGLLALYRFREGRGAIVHDSSGAGAPLDLRILGMRAVTWTPDALSLHGTTRIDSEAPASKITEACRKSGEVTIEAWVKPSKLAVDFEGCVLSLSTDVQDRNVALVQGENAASKDLWVAALRTSETDGGGSPRLLTPKASTELKWTHLAFTRAAAGVEKLFVNGAVRATRTRGGTFSTWNGAFRLILGNESFEERPWAGDYRLVAVYSRALTDVEVARIHKGGVE